jgi:hypothetical protein
MSPDSAAEIAHRLGGSFAVSDVTDCAPGQFRLPKAWRHRLCIPHSPCDGPRKDHMHFESEAAAGWAALLLISLFIAVTIVAGCYFYIYSLEARDMRELAGEPCTMLELIWSEIPM